ncbi:hypothetical protein [Asanoa iriomotensis]|uniref:hypothetical protein n=1 Tax=Asanoa iriomotensis TaxID=234613 RepID=UPI0019404340|nr:hypothetical protein [Asanoa iriomotensis]
MSADYIRALVDRAPELTDAQRADLARLLAPARRTDRTTRPAGRKDKGRAA